ncbi:arginine--tRNA ligase [Nitrospira defluvii]|nr:arginine--tRNA ligase [Nitrospira defluvii]
MSVKNRLSKLLETAVSEARIQGVLEGEVCPKIVLEVPKRESQGDFATTLALSLAKIEKQNPRDLAKRLASLLEGRSDDIEKIDVAGPGYINFFMTKSYWHKMLLEIHEKKENYGRSDAGGGKSVQIEFVSANPTGPLHVAHGRAAALGDALGCLLEAVGYRVSREYYMNDVGGQMALLGQSTYLRYRELFGEMVTLPEGSYQGDYIIEIAKQLKASDGDRYLQGTETERLPFFTSYSVQTIVEWIKNDLWRFGVEFDDWFSESEMVKKNDVKSALAFLKTKQVLYEKDGATWVSTMRFGDDKDRVVVKSDGRKTYFASDIAYHRNKFERGYDRLINIFGADHHGYIGRINAAVAAMGYPADRLTFLIHQLVNLLRDGKPVRMSKRAGVFVTLREVIDEVGVDATRFFFLMRRSDTAVDFDLELAKKASNENPVYYVQYAYARLCSIVRVAEEQGWDVIEVGQNTTCEDLAVLALSEEQNLIKQLSQYPDLLRSAAEALEPHRITFYLQALAGMLHSYYFKCRVITEDRALSRARLVLITAVRVVLKNGLDLLGIRAPERM